MSIQKQMVEQLYGLAEKAQHPDQIKALQEQITKSIQDGAVPSYAAIPLVQELTERLQKAQAMQQGPASQAQGIQQPPIAQQVLAQAQGLDRLPSNLPTEPQAYAAGGIVAFAGGDLVDDDETETEDDRQESALMSLMSSARNKIQNLRASLPQSYEATLATQKSVEQKPEGVEGFLGKLEHLESRGRDYDAKGNILTSPKGAEGRMQVMRHTQRDPGFGVTPAKDKSPEELARVGRDYGIAMLNRYGNEKDAAMAYNWGPGNVDKWIAGGRKGPVPGEARQYASNFADGGIVGLAHGGEVKHYDGTDESLVKNEEPVSTLGSLFKRGFIPEFGTKSPEDIAFSEKYLADLKAKEAKQKALTAPELDLPFYKAVTPSERKNVEEQRAAILKGELPSPYAATSGYKARPTATSLQDIIATQAMEDQEANKRAVIPAEVSPKTESNKTDSGKKTTGENAPKVEEQPTPEVVDPYLEKYMGMLQKREEESAKQKDIDAYMAVVQAGLGMMGGSSPYALQNIGQGGSQGVASYAAAQKQRAAEDAATLSGYGKLYTAKQAADLRRDLAAESKDVRLTQLAQGREQAAAKLAQEKELKLNTLLAGREKQLETVAYNNVIKAIGNAFTDLTPEQKTMEVNRELHRLKSNDTLLKKYYNELGLPPVEADVGPAGAKVDTVAMYGLKKSK